MDTKMKKHLLTFLFILSFLQAQEPQEITLEDDFLKSLDDVSEIATKTKLNIDETPSFVTVLRSEKLKKLGVRNIFEALAFVPGVQLKKEASGVSVVVFRGATQKGEVKLMVDGVTINNTYRGSIYYYFDFPIELVKRIEVIRGAGSVLYGSNAISGVINIITNISQEDNENSVFVSAGNYDNSKIGTYLSTNMSDFKLALDAYLQKTDKNIDNTDRHLDDYSFGLDIRNKELSLLARIKKSDAGNAYGILGIKDTDNTNFKNVNTSIYSQISYNTHINKNNEIKILASYNKYIQEVDFRHPANFAINTIYKENSYVGELNLISKSILDNELLVGLRYEYANTLQSEWKINNSIDIDPISKPNLTRRIFSIYLNDTYALTQSLNISAGFRFDEYDDFGDALNPNVGLVYKLNKKITLKALYSHSFRAPSWVELTSNPTLQAEKSNSLEAGLIYKHNQQNTLRLNLYTSKIDDMISKDFTTRKYIQYSNSNFLGSEVEYIFIPNNQLELNIFASYIDAQDKNNVDLADVAHIIASTSISYETDNGFTFGSVLRYVSPSKRSSNDIRGDMQDSLVFDQSITYEYKDFTASLTIKDLFNNNTYYALPNNTQQQDFDDGGREVVFNIRLDF
jgi:iron complex outermembrane receptor protein